MFFIKGIVFILIVVGIFVTGEKVLRKKFDISKRDKNRPRYVNKVHMWGENLILIAFIASMFFVTVEFSETRWIGLGVAFFFLLIEFFRALMEWIYQKEQREYIIHLFAALIIIIFVLVAAYTNWLDLLLGF
ncbi:MAG: DUF4181 domain-containing protein [Paenisporosarcina sp.]|uniref:DUF4181 domain-containing protein n=1 Tax=Paenisporosarcina sp. TaxID=1932001 RepID=UPI003C738383